MGFKYSFKNQCRHHQSRFRSEELQVDSGDYENVLTDEDGFDKGLNFYQGFEILKSVHFRYPNFRKPLYCNLLRSEHIPFNFFIPLDVNKDFRRKVFNEILGGIINQIVKIEIEYPDKTPTHYLDDRTSFDTFVEYKHIDGTIGILGIEVKYTEKSYPYSGKTEKDKMEDTNSIYYRRSEESGVFLNLDGLKKDEFRQVWRNHLLGESILMVDKPKYNHIHSLTFYPSGNTHFTNVIKDYKEFLRPEYKERVQGVTYERFFESCRNHLPNEEFGKWLEYLGKRYLTNLKKN
jgi:hypothetical protein